MSAEVTEATLAPVLEQAAQRAQEEGLGYAGGVTPAQAWALFQAGDAVLVDVRTGEELKFVGHVPGSINVPWAYGTTLIRNPRFARELEARLASHGGKQAVVLLLCRSGKRSVLAATAAKQAGFNHVFNILEGFEGEINAAGQRGHDDGWRFRGLPWVQD